MALLIRGKTKCALCGKAIEELDAVVGFSSFLKNSHPLALYSDEVFHAKCFDQSPDKAAVIEIYDLYRKIWDSRPRNLKSTEEINAWQKEAFKDFL